MSHTSFFPRAGTIALLLMLSACSTATTKTVETRPRGATAAQWFESLPSTRHSIVVDVHDELPRFHAHRDSHLRADSKVVSTSGFVRLVASCNARVGASGGFTLSVRVRERVDAPWSPWCTLLAWGAVPDDATIDMTIDMTFAGGRVAVDELLLERAHVDFQYRVDAFGDVELEHVCVCTSAPLVSPSGTEFDSTWRPRRAVDLDVRARSQASESATIAHRVCSPTALAMVLHWHGVDVPTHTVAALVFDHVHDLYGNWPRNVQGAFEFGVPALLVRFDSWDAVEATLARGLPIVASIGVAPGELDGAPYAATAGHLIVVRGIDEHGDVFVVDPAAAPTPAASTAAEGTPRTYRREQLDKVWMERGGTAYVLLGR